MFHQLQQLLQAYTTWKEKVSKRQRLVEDLGAIREEVDAEQLQEQADARGEDQEDGLDNDDEPQYEKRGTHKIHEGTELDQLVHDLNNGQRAIFSKVVNQIRHQVLHSEMQEDENSCIWKGCTSAKAPAPVRQIVLGGAGTGKSRLIFALNGQVHRDSKLPSHLLRFPVGSAEENSLLAVDKNKADFDYAIANNAFPDAVSINAPTGVAAYLISGSTIHSTFAVPIIKSQDISAPPPMELSNERLKAMKRRFRQTRLIIIDEVTSSVYLCFTFNVHHFYYS